MTGSPMGHRGLLHRHRNIGNRGTIPVKSPRSGERSHRRLDRLAGLVRPASLQSGERILVHGGSGAFLFKNLQKYLW
jgi:hypothetical protein